MPNNNPTTNNNSQKIAKDDVIWVPYRRDPLWPALVHNVYPKKVTYSFFPLADDGESVKKNTFSCHPKLTYALVTTEPLATTSDVALLKAFRSASEFLFKMGKTRGSEIESLGEALKRERIEEEAAEMTDGGSERVGKKRREQTKSEEDHEDHDMEPPSPKKCASVSSDRSTPIDFYQAHSSQQPPITQQQSNEMMILINDRFDSLIEEIWQSDEVMEMQKQTRMRDKLTVKLRNNQFLSETDYESLFERIVDHIRQQKNQSISLIGAFNLTASHVIPHLLITCFATWKNVEIREAREIFYQHSTRVLGLDSSMDIPTTDHLEELCRLACNESDAIRNN